MDTIISLRRTLVPVGLALAVALGLALLLFAAVVSLGLGYALARALAQRVTALHQSARALAGGDLTARVAAAGTDELAALAAEFNVMAAQLSAAAAERERLEAARRDL